MAIDKNFYNEASSAKLGWTPNWFGEDDFDEELVKAVKKFQRRAKITSDGLVGPTTFRRIFTEREAGISNYSPNKVTSGAYGDALSCNDVNYIVHNGSFLPIKWPKVVLWDESNGLRLSGKPYTSMSGRSSRQPKIFVNHWDVCLSAESCARVLSKRGVSVHFCIDNDGTIYQLLDTQHVGWHAGGRSWNNDSIGVEISNAYYTKYQDWYVKNGFGERPIMEGATCHGRSMKPFLGFYDIQLEALKRLWAAIHLGLGIPLDFPKDENGELNTGVSKECANSSFSGFINHYNLTRGKIDCAGLDLKGLLEDTKNII